MNTDIIENPSLHEGCGDFGAEAREQLAVLTEAYQRLRLSAEAARRAAWADVISFSTTAASSTRSITFLPCNP